jgi:hypothetical protein
MGVYGVGVVKRIASEYPFTNTLEGTMASIRIDHPSPCAISSLFDVKCEPSPLGRSRIFPTLNKRLAFVRLVLNYTRRATRRQHNGEQQGATRHA